MKRSLAGLVLLLVTAVHAATLHGKVSHVTDGDTLWVRPAHGGRPVAVRLLDVDAPEACQPFGPEAKQALRSRVQGAAVVVRTRGVDDYGRQLARVEHRGHDLGRWLVRGGYAWSMRFHGRSGPYAHEEALARREHKGLWADAQAVEPRTFRKRHGRCQ
jgi:endonuclease YncB( thermonuclease family)